MIDNSKISIAPLNPIAIENLNNSGKVKFSRQKTDESLSAFREGGSHADTFASTVAEDPILRTFFFLASTRTPQFDRKYPILEVIPITLSSNYDITDKIASSFSDKITETRQKREKASKQTTNAFRSISYRLMGLVLKDEAMVKARSKRETEFSQIMDSTIKRHEKELAPIMTGFIDSFKDLSETINFGRIIAFLDVVQTALRNAKILNHAVQLPNKKESLFASLNGLARTDSVKLEIESCCLDCYFKYNDDPYYSLITNPRDIELKADCPRCKSDMIFHNVKIHYPVGLSKMVQPDTDWLQEVLMGYSLSSIDTVRKVYIHQKIHSYDNQSRESTGIESDISLLTQDGRLVLVEVTREKSFETVLENANRKARNLQERNIPYSSLGLVSNSVISGDYLTIEAEKSRLFAAKHVSKINEFVANDLINWVPKRAST